MADGYLLQRYWPFMASMAASDASKPSKLTKPKPLLDPLSGSLMILGVAMTMPNALKVSYSSCTAQCMCDLGTNERQRIPSMDRAFSL